MESPRHLVTSSPRHLVTSSLLLILGACVSPSEGDLVPFSERGTAEPGRVVPVASEPGYYTLALSGTTRTASLVQVGRSLYRYAGQYRFRYPTPNDAGGEVWAIDEAPIDEVARIENSLIVDKEGRQWDWIGWAESGPAEWSDGDGNTSNEEEAGPSVDANDGVSIGGDEAHWGVPYQAQLLSWDTIDCSNSLFSISDHGIWNSESRAISSYATTPEKASVYVLVRGDHNGDGIVDVATCSGAVLPDSNGDSTRVLTAAHCVSSDGTNTGVALLNNIRVCTYGNQGIYSANVSCRNVDWVNENTAYFIGTHNTNEDFAVLEVEGPELNVPSNFALSALGPSTWDTKTIYLNAHDGFVPGAPASCTQNLVSGAQSMFGGTYSSGVRLHRQSHSDEDSYSSDQIRTTFDAAGGSSGAAYYYCPSNCATSTSAIVGLQTTWDGTLNRMKGPQVGLFKTFVENTF